MAIRVRIALVSPASQSSTGTNGCPHCTHLGFFRVPNRLMKHRIKRGNWPELNDSFPDVPTINKVSHEQSPTHDQLTYFLSTAITLAARRRGNRLSSGSKRETIRTRADKWETFHFHEYQWTGLNTGRSFTRRHEHHTRWQNRDSRCTLHCGRVDASDRPSRLEIHVCWNRVPGCFETVAGTIHRRRGTLCHPGVGVDDVSRHHFAETAFGSSEFARDVNSNGR